MLVDAHDPSCGQEESCTANSKDWINQKISALLLGSRTKVIRDGLSDTAFLRSLDLHPTRPRN